MNKTDIKEGENEKDKKEGGDEEKLTYIEMMTKREKRQPNS